jgi:hypothetical protein
MPNIPLILELGKNVQEYRQFETDHRTLTNLVNQHFPAHRLKGHKTGCSNNQTSTLGYHGSYLRKCVIDTEGVRHQLRIHRVYCRACLQTWSVYPSILVPRKRRDSYVVQNLLETTLSHETSYRGALRQHKQLTSSGCARPNCLKDARTLWGWVQWLGQWSIPQVLLACGLLPPHYGVEDEKFLSQNGQKSYAVGVVDHRYELLWWLDYVFATDETALKTSLTALQTVLQTVDPHHYWHGITGDDWPAAKNAFRALNPDTKLAQCLLHPMLKFEDEVARYARYFATPPQRVRELKAAFWQILVAPDPQSWETQLNDLALWPEFAHPILADRLKSLQAKKAGLWQRFYDPNLALTSSAIDRKFARLERKLASMQQFRTDQSGRASLNAWGIVHDFRRFGADAKREGLSPVELAGLDLNERPWLQFILINLSKCRWLKSLPHN